MSRGVQAAIDAEVKAGDLQRLYTLQLFPRVTSFGKPPTAMPRLTLSGTHVTQNQAEVFMLICKNANAPRLDALRQ